VGDDAECQFASWHIILRPQQFDEFNCGLNDDANGGKDFVVHVTHRSSGTLASPGGTVAGCSHRSTSYRASSCSGPPILHTGESGLRGAE
jgi:hypothetical protein